MIINTLDKAPSTYALCLYKSARFAISIAALSTFVIFSTKNSYGLQSDIFVLNSRNSHIVLDIPISLRFRHSKQINSGIFMSLMTFYPDFASLSDPAFLKYGLGCRGYCHGRIAVTLEIKDSEAVASDVMKKVYLDNITFASKFPNSKTVILQDDRQRTEETQKIYDPKTNYLAREARYFFVRANKEEPEYNGKCIPTAMANSCEIYFSPACPGNLLIGVQQIDSSLEPKFGQISKDIIEFVRKMIRSTKCSSS